MIAVLGWEAIFMQVRSRIRDQARCRSNIKVRTMAKMAAQVTRSWVRVRPDLVVLDWVGGSGLLWMEASDRQDLDGLLGLIEAYVT